MDETSKLMALHMCVSEGCFVVELVSVLDLVDEIDGLLVRPDPDHLAFRVRVGFVDLPYERFAVT